MTVQVQSRVGNPITLTSVGNYVLAPYATARFEIPAETSEMTTMRAAWLITTSIVQSEAQQGPEGLPSTETVNRELVDADADDGKNLVMSGTRVMTVNKGRMAGWGVAIKGTVSFAGTATINDIRTTGAANPWCALMCIGTDVYDCVGGKA